MSPDNNYISSICYLHGVLRQCLKAEPDLAGFLTRFSFVELSFDCALLESERPRSRRQDNIFNYLKILQ